MFAFYSPYVKRDSAIMYAETVGMRLPAAVVLACASALSQQTQTPLPEGVYRTGNGVTQPSVIRKTDPEYAEEARIAQMSGTVMLSVIVGEDGNVRDIHVERPVGLGLDDKAIEAVRAWQFKPGLKDGMPVPVAVHVEINFRLSRESRWALSRAVFNPPEGTTRPFLAHAPYPPDSITAADLKNGPDGSVAVSFDVAPNGMTENLHIEKSSNSALESEVIRIVRGWQFRPGMKDGQPGSVRCAMEFFEGKVP
jgi:TonB family protein